MRRKLIFIKLVIIVNTVIIIPILHPRKKLEIKLELEGARKLEKLIQSSRENSNGSLHKKNSIKDFFSKCDEIRSFLRIWSHLLKKSFMENFILCAVVIATIQKIFLGLNLRVGITPLYVFQLFKKCM